ncbi:MAG: hypothetical protein CMH60_02260 [Myxococcales bacterium]|nr:hypothetical protein [Myxococcales bacterium]
MRHIKQLCYTILLIGLSAAACSEPEDKYYIMDSLRVMAVKAEKPWLSFGESTSLDALVFNPEAEALSYKWSWCPARLNSVTGYACPLDQAALDALVTQTSEGELTAPSLDLGTEATASFDNAFPGELLTAICYGALEGSGNIGAAEIDCASTYGISIVLEVSNSSETITAIKDLQLIIDSSLSANQNPTIDGLSLTEFDSTMTDEEVEDQLESFATEAESFSATQVYNVVAEKKYALFADISEDAAETYESPASDETAQAESIQEALVISWFIEVGEFQSTRTGYIPDEIDLATAAANVWTPPLDLSEYEKSTAKIYVVVRDDRAGSTWLERSFDLSALEDSQ